MSDCFDVQTKVVVVQLALSVISVIKKMRNYFCFCRYVIY